MLTLEEAARFLRVSLGELGQLADWGQVPGRRIGGHWRFSRAALLAWLAGDWGAYGRAHAPVASAEYVYQPAPVSAAAPYPAATVTQPPSAQILPPASMARVAGAGTTLAQSEVLPEPAEPTDEAPEEPIGEAPEEPIGEAPEDRTADEIFLRLRNGFS